MVFCDARLRILNITEKHDTIFVLFYRQINEMLDFVSEILDTLRDMMRLPVQMQAHNRMR